MTDPQIEIVRDADKARERCDFCKFWLPLGTGRVMGWCQNIAPAPKLFQPSLILLGRIAQGQPRDPLTAYNQVCAHLAKGNGHD